MAEEKFAVNTESFKTVENINDLSEMLKSLTVPKDEVSNEAAAISLQKSNEFKGNENPSIYQTDVVETETETGTITTERPDEPDSEDADETTATSTESETEVAAESAGETDTPAETAAPAEAPTEAPAEVPTETQMEAPTDAPTEAPTEIITEMPATTAEEVPAAQLAQTEIPLKEEITTVPPSGEPKDPYALEIPVSKKINKRTQRKLWEEIERRKPLIPKHVAEHIQKYAKPPFETWGCKFRGKGSCFGCK